MLDEEGKILDSSVKQEKSPEQSDPTEKETVEKVPADVIQEEQPPLKEEDDLQLQELKKLNETFSEYIKKQEDEHLAAVKKQDETNLLETEKENDFRSQVIELLTPSEEVTDEGSDEQIQLLQAISEQLAPNPEQTKIDTAAYYGNLSIIIVVMGILPTYIAYRFLKGIFSLTKHIL